MKNNLADLANMLFEQMDKLDEISSTNTKKLKNEIAKTNAKLDITKGILEIGKLQLQAQKQLGGFNRKKDEIIPELLEAKRTAGLGLPPVRG